ncbi:MAG: phosphatidate cytidylyltransferase [Prolixibacteraceae bacterium]|nr:phosphatidate cytidylyltransferase [Prolixibacteraceae bacterium]
MSDLLKRSVTGVIFVLVLLSGTFFHPFSFAVVFLVLLFFTQLEFYKLVERAGHTPQKPIGLILGIVLFLVCFAARYGILSARFCFFFIPSLPLIFLFEVLRTKKNPLINAALTLLGFIYVAVPFSLLNFIVFPGSAETPTFYPGILIGTFFIIWIYDSVAYLAGSTFGKHKLAEKISPNKSWEGLIAGAIFAIVMGILNAVLFSALNMIEWISIAVLIIVFGTFGDLFESNLKRNLKIKDSGSILPGHGGLLDRFDSFLFAVPVVFILLLFIKIVL